MKNKLNQKLSKKNVVIASHIFSSGPALDLEKFLKDKTKSLFFVGHPFSFRNDKRSFYRLYKGGKLTEDHKAIEWILPEVLLYLKDAFYTLFWVGTKKEKIDLFIGSDNFTAYLGLLLKKLGKVKDVVLYTIDYLPQRFKNPLLNFLYHYFDRKCLKECKIVWNVSPKMAEARKAINIQGNRYVSQIIVPLGMWDKRIPKLPLSKKNRYQLVFLGHILEKQGLDIVLDGLSQITRKISKVKLVVLGTGPHEEALKRKAKKLKIESHVDFRGYIADHKQVEKTLAESVIGVAMYKPDPESFTYLADPAKLKNYLSAGLPILLTDVPPIAKELEAKKCAVLVEYDKTKFVKSAVELLKNSNRLEGFSQNSFKLARNYDWEIIFERALSQSLL